MTIKYKNEITASFTVADHEGVHHRVIESKRFAKVQYVSGDTNGWQLLQTTYALETDKPIEMDGEMFIDKMSGARYRRI